MVAYTYKRPSSFIVILGDVNIKVINKLSVILRNHGPHGLKIYVVYDDLEKNLEILRDFLLNNYAFTIEVYMVSRSELSNILKESVEKPVSIYVTNPEYVNSIPVELRSLAEAV